MVTKPLRIATKKANLKLSADACIEAIEYDRYQPPPLASASPRTAGEGPHGSGL